MATESQLIANRSNAQASAGPVRAEGKSRVSRNATDRILVRPYPHDTQTQRSTRGQGLFSAGDFVLRDEAEIYAEFCAAYQADLAPVGPVEETFAAEIIHAAWCLRRCSTIEESIRLKDGAWNIEETQRSVERARAAAFRIFTRANTELRKIQLIDAQNWYEDEAGSGRHFRHAIGALIERMRDNPRQFPTVYKNGSARASERHRISGRFSEGHEFGFRGGHSLGL